MKKRLIVAGLLVSLVILVVASTVLAADRYDLDVKYNVPNNNIVMPDSAGPFTLSSGDHIYVYSSVQSPEELDIGLCQYNSSTGKWDDVVVYYTLTSSGGADFYPSAGTYKVFRRNSGDCWIDATSGYYWVYD